MARRVEEEGEAALGRREAEDASRSAMAGFGVSGKAELEMESREVASERLLVREREREKEPNPGSPMVVRRVAWEGTRIRGRTNRSCNATQTASEYS